MKKLLTIAAATAFATTGCSDIPVDGTTTETFPVPTYTEIVSSAGTTMITYEVNERGKQIVETKKFNDVLVYIDGEFNDTGSSRTRVRSLYDEAARQRIITNYGYYDIADSSGAILGSRTVNTKEEIYRIDDDGTETLIESHKWELNSTGNTTRYEHTVNGSTVLVQHTFQYVGSAGYTYVEEKTADGTTTTTELRCETKSDGYEIDAYPSGIDDEDDRISVEDMKYYTEDNVGLTISYTMLTYDAEGKNPLTTNYRTQYKNITVTY